MLTFENFISICTVLGSSSVLLATINSYAIKKNKEKTESLKTQKEELINLYLPLKKLFFQCDKENCFEYLKENRNKIHSILLDNFIYVPTYLNNLFYKLNKSLQADEPDSSFNENYEKINNRITAKYEELKSIFYYPSIPIFKIAELRYTFIKKLPTPIRYFVYLIIEFYKAFLQILLVITIFISVVTTIVALFTDKITFEEQILVIISFLLIIYSAYILHKSSK